jgi:hypothetical protein
MIRTSYPIQVAESRSQGCNACSCSSLQFPAVQHDPTQVPGSLQHFMIGIPFETVINGCEHINPAPSKLLRNCQWNVDVHIQSNRHLKCSLGPEPKNDG